MTKNTHKKTNRSKLGIHIIEGIEYINLPSVADKYGMSLNSIYKRYSRGFRGDQLVPRHKHNSYVEPIYTPNYKYIVKGIGYMSKAEACRKNNIKLITFIKRMSYGWSFEEALTIPTKIYHDPNKKLGSGTAVAITVEGKNFISISDAANNYGLAPENVRQALLNGDTIDQAFKLVEKSTIHSFEYKGKYYKDLRHLADNLGFPYKLLSSRVHYQKISIEESISLGKDKILNVGRYNKTVLDRDKDLASKIGKLYFARVSINQNVRYKIGITAQSINNRLSKEFSNYEIIKFIKLSLYECFQLEKKLLNTFSEYRDMSITSDQLDGYKEVFDFPEKILKKINSIINTNEKIKS